MQRCDGTTPGGVIRGQIWGAPEGVSDLMGFMWRMAVRGRDQTG